MSLDAEAVALIAYIGGFSAATGMVIVASVALATMVSNDLVVPMLLRWRALKFAQRADISAIVLGIRRITIVVLSLMAYAYYRLTESSQALASIGISRLRGGGAVRAGHRRRPVLARRQPARRRGRARTRLRAVVLHAAAAEPGRRRLVAGFVPDQRAVRPALAASATSVRARRARSGHARHGVVARRQPAGRSSSSRLRRGPASTSACARNPSSARRNRRCPPSSSAGARASPSTTCARSPPASSARTARAAPSTTTSPPMAIAAVATWRTATTCSSPNACSPARSARHRRDGC
jgi:hypothetical protein